MQTPGFFKNPGVFFVMGFQAARQVMDGAS